METLSPSALQALAILLSLILILLALTTWHRWRAICVACDRFRAREWWAVAAVVATALAVRLLVVPSSLIHTNFHQFHFLNALLAPPESDPAQLWTRTRYGVAPYAFFQLLFRYLPRTPELLQVTNATLSAASCGLLYFLARLLGAAAPSALTAGLLLALFLPHAMMAPTENDQVLVSWLALGALVQLVAWLNRPSRVLLVGMTLTTIAACHARILILHLPLAMALVVLLRARREQLGMILVNLLPAALLVAVAALPQLVLVCRLQSISPAARLEGPVALLAQLTIIGRNLLLTPSVVTPLLAVLALAGLAHLGRRRPRTALLLALALIGETTLYLFFSAHILDALRYQYFVWPFFALAAGFAVDWLEGARPWSIRAAIAATLLLFAVTQAPFFPVATRLTAVGRESRFILENLSRLPPGSKLVENTPLEVPGDYDIAPLVFPDFLAREAGLARHPWPPATSDSLPPAWPEGALFYIGLQNQVYRPSEAETHGSRRGPRLPPALEPLRDRLRPVLTTTFNPGEITPGPGLEFAGETVEIGFYRLGMNDE